MEVLTYVLKGLLCFLLGNRLWRMGEMGNGGSKETGRRLPPLSVVRTGMRVAVPRGQKGMDSGHRLEAEPNSDCRCTYV